MTNVAAERDAFEAWYAKRHPTPTHENSTRAHCAKMDDWEVWQARAGAAPAAVAGPAGDLTELELLNRLIELGGEASYALAQSNSDDGRAGAEADDRWRKLRAEMGELIRAHKAPALEAPAHQCCNSWFASLPEGRQAVLRNDKWMLASAAYEAGRESCSALEAPAAETIAQAITDNFRDAGWSMPSIDAARVLEAVKSALGPAAAPQAPRLGEVALHLLRRLLSNQHTLTGPEFRAELEKIVAEESARHAAAPQAPAPGMAVTALAGEIIAALEADEKDGGYDLTSGLFGPKFSVLVRRWAASEWAHVTAPQAPNCTRCSGSGEDPEGYLTHGRGPDDHTVDGPCRSCDGSGAAPQAPAAPSDWVAPVRELLGHLSNVLGDEAFAKIDTTRWNAVSALIGTTQAAPAAPAVDASDDTALLDFLQETATAVEVLTQDEGEPPRFLVNRAISKDVRSAIRMARGKAIAAQAKEGGA